MKIVLFVVSSLLIAACCIQPPPTPSPSPRPVGPRLIGAEATSADWTIPSGGSAWGGALKVGVGEGSGFRALLVEESLRSAGGGQGPSTRHLSLNFRLEGKPQGRFPLRAIVRRASDARLLSGLSEDAFFNMTEFGVVETGELRFVLCPTETGVNLANEKLSIDAWIVSDGGAPDAGVLAKVSGSFIPLCTDTDCTEACGG